MEKRERCFGDGEEYGSKTEFISNIEVLAHHLSYQCQIVVICRHDSRSGSSWEEVSSINAL